MTINNIEKFNIASFLIDERNLNRGNSENVAIYYNDISFTYRELSVKINKCGNYLKSIGIKAEEKIGLYMYDRPEFIFLFFGAIKVGIIPVIMNPKLSADNICDIINSTKCEQVFTDGELAVNIQDKFSESLLKNVDDICNKAQKFDEYCDTADTNKDDISLIIFTSGSSGKPKGVIHSHINLLGCMEIHGKYGLDVKSSDIVFSHSKMSFAYGMNTRCLIPLYEGASTIICNQDSVYDIIDVLHKYPVTIFCAVPSVYQSLLGLLDEGENLFKNCKRCCSAGEPQTKALSTAWKDKVGMDIYTSFGTSELLSAVIGFYDDNIRYGSMGKAYPGYEVMILDDQGNPTNPGEIGNLIIKGKSIMLGYWKNDELTKQVIEHGTLKTGDMCYFDEDGFIWYAGRSTDAFKVNGVWESAIPLEEIILSHPNIVEAVVVSEVGEQSSSTIVAYLVAKDLELHAETVKEIKGMFFKQKMRTFCPKEFNFISELPKGATGKVKRSGLNMVEIIIKEK